MVNTLEADFKDDATIIEPSEKEVSVEKGQESLEAMQAVTQEKIQEELPYFAEGEVVKGFGRGSSELGIPTANFNDEIVRELPTALETGVYFGWARIGNGTTHKMVMSIGLNPFYDNKERSMETHVMHTFPEQFYGQHMKVFITGYIRPMKNYSCVDDLIQDIHADIKYAGITLDTPQHCELKEDARITAAI